MNSDAPQKSDNRESANLGSECNGDDYVRQLEELERDFKELEARIDTILEPSLIAKAGEYLAAMLSSPEGIEKWLSNADPKLREAALEIAYRKWTVTQKVADMCESMSISDSDDGVRSTAVRVLGTYYRKSKSPRIGRFLASIARDDSEGEALRLSAFTSLLRIHGNMDYAGPSPLVPTSLDQIDWAFVNEYYQGKTQESGLD